MTRKDYKEIASVIRRHRSEDTSGTMSGTLSMVADSLALVFQADNPRFDRARFFVACGMDENGIWVI